MGMCRDFAQLGPMVQGYAVGGGEGDMVVRGVGIMHKLVILASRQYSYIVQDLGSPLLYIDPIVMVALVYIICWPGSST
jgi:hypothetical protein